MQNRRRVVVVTASLVAVTVAAPSSWAGRRPPRPPKDVPAISQYVETIPSAGGGQLPGSGRGSGFGFSSRAAAAIKRAAGADASALRRVATAPAYGAPQTGLPRARGRPHGAGGFAGATLSAATTDRIRVLGLGAVLVLISAGVAAAAARRGQRAAH